jgi:hypothetical protein
VPSIGSVVAARFSRALWVATIRIGGACEACVLAGATIEVGFAFAHIVL